MTRDKKLKRVGGLEQTERNLASFNCGQTGGMKRPGKRRDKRERETRRGEMR